MKQPLLVLGGDETGLAVVRNAAALGFRPIVVARPRDVCTRSRLAECIVLDAPPGGERLSAFEAFQHRSDRPPLVATNDRWLRCIMAQRAALDAQFIVLHPGNAVLDICLNKRRFAEWAGAHGIPTPELVDVFAGARTLPFPVLLRPEWSNQVPSDRVPKATAVADIDQFRASVGLFEASGAAWVATRSLLREAQAQYSVAVGVRDGQCVSFVAEKVRPFPDQCAVGSYVELRPHDAVESLARRTIEAIGFDVGVAEVEIIGTRAGELFVIEVNPRPWTQFALSRRSGHDLLALAVGTTRAARRTPRRHGLAWMAFTYDLFVCFSRSTGLVRHGRLGLGTYLRSLARARVFSKFVLNDPYPALGELADAVAAVARRSRARAARHELVASRPAAMPYRPSPEVEEALVNKRLTKRPVEEAQRSRAQEGWRR